MEFAKKLQSFRPVESLLLLNKIIFELIHIHCHFCILVLNFFKHVDHMTLTKINFEVWYKINCLLWG